MIDHLASRQVIQLDGLSRTEMTAKFEAIESQFGIEWLSQKSDNPLQLLWNRKDHISTNELLNFGNALEELERVDMAWTRRCVAKIKGDDEGNRAGAIFELLGLSMFLRGGNKTIPAAGSKPGYDGTVELPNGSSWVISIKNHGMTSYEKLFLQKANYLDKQFRLWLREQRRTGIELRIASVKYLDSIGWDKLRSDVKRALGNWIKDNRQVNPGKEFEIAIRLISPEYGSLSKNRLSSVTSIFGKPHQNEQKRFIDNLRGGCSNLIKHTGSFPETTCRVLFVRLSENASLESCKDWAVDYFRQFPNEHVGVILLYQAAIVTSDAGTSIGHYLLPIEGPQYKSWSNLVGNSERKLPDMSVLVGTILKNPSKKIIKADDINISLNDMYSYQKGNIYQSHSTKKLEDFQFNLFDPVPGVKVYQEINTEEGTITFNSISNESDRLTLLP